ncbi:disease resistance protein RPV1-like [Rosa chinensis]|uniref:disease resistance protein RPV1-like n=1 Tax=Rosa chinensis TaxID=74649 RepID=UPI000D08BBC1|nr:disease resistance protein RPV1-like [Rosa chinensis]
MEKVQIWKAALKEAANLSGWPLLDENCSESSFIHEIVEEISEQVINSTYLDGAKYPVGIKPWVQEIHKVLGVEGRDMGASGIGKTTIARAFYKSNLMGVIFWKMLEKIQWVLARGFVKLQKKLLREILKTTLKVANVARGITMIKEMLQYKSVLLVLDDVNDIDQLNNLAGKCSWFDMGSRIIITTRDKQLLTNHSINLIYEVQELDHHEALELFSRIVFKNGPLDGFAVLTECAICYADQGLPLALTVLGSSLSPKIREALQISYDGLDDIVKEIFLDIACFFKGESTNHVIQALEAYRGKPAKYGINVLIDKALINTSRGCIWMHDLLEEMGRDIVHQQSLDNPGKRSRLWFHEDVYHVLTELKMS